ncbi:alpha/beta hydrolase [uncultured Desulfuromusa sp.]|uniref:alpha/beta hydrolase n=1 Tax=uncultured Desulfuromusa sp. TaxID=219183 RepID=UPI002AA96101|nr:alpha/beta hydrolase [uncultured Desulfuromusa sp.]
MEKSKFIKAFLNAKPLPLEDISEARRLESARSSRSAKVPFPGHIDNVTAATALGTTKVRIYNPPGSGPFPVVLYMHGGGFSIGSPETSDNICRMISNSAKTVLISVDYGLAPEHKFPYALEECYQIALWIQENDVALNIRADQLIIAGDSAGGNLAASICLLAREREDFSPIYQVLICPLLDLQTEHEDKINGINDNLLTVENSRTFSSYYLQDSHDAGNPLVSPLLADSLSGLPPATIITAELDALATEAITYGTRLKSAGTSVIHRHYKGQVHDFVLFIRSLDEAKEAAENISRDIVRILTVQN